MTQTTTADVLQAFLEAEGSHVSGAKLAEALGVSRTAVWKRLEKLSTEGFEFEAVRNKGYRLIKEPTHLHADLLQAYLFVQRTEIHLQFLEETNSTNSTAERQLQEGADEPLVIIAKRQSAGRGRRGRAWRSDSEGSLYASFGYRPIIPPATLQKFTLWMGYSLAKWIGKKFGIEAKVKWPNDLQIKGKKLAGMLTEARMDTESVRDLVFGLGMNLSTDCANWDNDLKGVAVSLKEAGATITSLNAVTAELIGAVQKAYEQFCSGSHEQELMDNWPLYDALAGKKVWAERAGQRIDGIADGLDKDGSIRIMCKSGVIHLIQAGDISLRTSP